MEEKEKSPLLSGQHFDDDTENEKSLFVKVATPVREVDSDDDSVVIEEEEESPIRRALKKLHNLYHYVQKRLKEIKEEHFQMLADLETEDGESFVQRRTIG